MTSIEERHKLIEKDYYYLYISSHLFLIPVFISIYADRYDILWLSLSVLITSILKWGEPTNVYYQYIDHNWVKIIWMYITISFVEMLFKKPIDSCLTIYFAAILLSIVIFFIIGVIMFIFLDPYLCIPIHMLVHFYTVAGFITMLLFDYDYNKLFYRFFNFIKNFFRN